MRVGARYGIQNLGAEVRPLTLRCEKDLASGEQQSANALSMRNPTDEPFEVHEFKFYMRPQSSTVGRASGGFIQAALALEDWPITAGFVPAWGCSPANALDLERLTPTWARADSNANLFSAEFVPRREDGMYYWKLDHPMYVPPGAAIKVQFSHTGLDSTPVRAGLTASGRVLPGGARPASIRVPWVSCFQSKMVEAIAAAPVELSKETQLNNPFEKPLTVERFVGRIAQQIAFLASSDDQAIVSDLFSGPFERMFRVKHYDATGNLVCPTATYFRNLYGYRNRAWAVRHTMPPGSYHRVELTKIAAVAGTAYVAGSATDKVIFARGSAQVSLVGWREEKL